MTCRLISFEMYYVLNVCTMKYTPEKFHCINGLTRSEIGHVFMDVLCIANWRGMYQFGAGNMPGLDLLKSHFCGFTDIDLLDPSLESANSE